MSLHIQAGNSITLSKPPMAAPTPAPAQTYIHPHLHLPALIQHYNEGVTAP